MDFLDEVMNRMAKSSFDVEALAIKEVGKIKKMVVEAAERGLHEIVYEAPEEINTQKIMKTFILGLRSHGLKGFEIVAKSWFDPSSDRRIDVRWPSLDAYRRRKEKK